jgi:alanine dehydrogenase
MVDEAAAYDQDVVVVLRAPEGRYELLRRGSVLLSMLHFVTRPERVERLHELGIEAVALDMVTGDDGRRLVHNLRDVARNGLNAAFDALERRYPLWSPDREPVSVTIIGAGGVGKHAIEWAAKGGSEARLARMLGEGLPGIEVVVVEQALGRNEVWLQRRLAATDILVDATARRDPSRALVPNAWLGVLPEHAVICDLAVDPYLLDGDPPVVRGIEGIPQGSLDQWEFAVDDPAWDTLPPGIPTAHRRTVVSCYSWPGVDPAACMEVYGSQVTPLLKTLVWHGGTRAIAPGVSFHGRALWRGSLRRFRGEAPPA